MSAQSPLPAEEPLRRELSRLAIGALVLNGLIGAGIFGLPSKLAALVGAASVPLFLLSAVLMAAVMASFAQAASYFRGTGGPILYAGTAFGPLVGFETGWVLYLGRASAIAANTNLMVSYLAVFLPGVDAGAARVAALAVILGGLTAVNLVGLRQGVRTLYALTVLKLSPLLLFVLVGLVHAQPAALADLRLPDYGTFGSAMVLVFYAFIGFEGALIPAGEARDPQRDMPRALLWTLGVTTVAYVLIQAVCVMVLPDLAASDKPLASAAAHVVGPVGATVMSLAAIVSIYGNSASSMLTAPRMTYAMARDGHLPSFLAAVNPRWSTPHASILLYGGLTFALAVSGGFVWLAGMSTLTRLVGYGLCVAALPRLRRRLGDEASGFALPGGLAIPGAALIVCAWLLTQVDLDALVLTAAFLLLGAALFYAGGQRGR